MINVHAVNPLRYNEKRVNVLGKLEAVEEGSKNSLFEPNHPEFDRITSSPFISIILHT